VSRDVIDILPGYITIIRISMSYDNKTIFPARFNGTFLFKSQVLEYSDNSLMSSIYIVDSIDCLYAPPSINSLYIKKFYKIRELCRLV